MVKFFFRRYAIIYILLAAGTLAFSAGCKKSDAPGAPGPVASGWKPGDVFYDKEHWTECVVGSMPLIITVPHGGTLAPANIPDRSCPGIVTVTDSHTMELAREISKVLGEKYGIHPYLVICHLKRTKIDQNRGIDEGTCGHRAMVAPWNRFHDYIDTALTDMVKQFGSALYIDLHGHGHSKQRLELGYSLGINDLGNVYTSTNLETMWHQSSLNNLRSIHNGRDFRSFIIGDKAFGTLMENEGFPAVPGKQEPYPQSSDPFFNGGYNTRLYTGSEYPKVFGWQIESNYTGVRDTEESRAAFARAFAEVIMQYMQHTMNYNP